MGNAALRLGSCLFCYIKHLSMFTGIIWRVHSRLQLVIFLWMTRVNSQRIQANAQVMMEIKSGIKGKPTSLQFNTYSDYIYISSVRLNCGTVLLQGPSGETSVTNLQLSVHKEWWVNDHPSFFQGGRLNPNKRVRLHILFMAFHSIGCQH